MAINITIPGAFDLAGAQQDMTELFGLDNKKQPVAEVDMLPDSIRVRVHLKADEVTDEQIETARKLLRRWRQAIVKEFKGEFNLLTITDAITKLGVDEEGNPLASYSTTDDSLIVRVQVPEAGLPQGIMEQLDSLVAGHDATQLPKPQQDYNVVVDSLLPFAGQNLADLGAADFRKVVTAALILREHVVIEPAGVITPPSKILPRKVGKPEKGT